ncbi:MAG TPA: signal recognition particle-docking protein FtsY [Polyangiaceae bacterium]|jgi:fused signal recognition particle receptor|nr:signal recognition particle-docking protein FtsY [Polyangiaceae bacterium]
MDVIIYIGIAVAVIALLLLFRKKKPQDPKQALDQANSAARTKAASEASGAQARKGGADRTASTTKETTAKAQAEKAAQADASLGKSESLKESSSAVPAKTTPEGELEGPPSGARKRGDLAVSPSDAPARPSRQPPARDVKTLREGLSRSRQADGFFGRLLGMFSSKKEISPELSDQIEEVLLTSDVGVGTTRAILERIRADLGNGQLKSETDVWRALRTETRRILDIPGAGGGLKLRNKPTVILFVGVNGAGKTTTIGKLATKLQGQGKTCLLAAGDTFRAAAVQQLVVWGQRVGCEVVRGKDGADPGSVLFDAVKKAQELNVDVVLADTAGRLHTKSNLMAEMQKIARTIGKALDGAPHEYLLVIDATNGQNAMAQAQEFKDTLPLSGIVLTKLDGTAKGGVVLGISDSLKLPVRFIGLGERPDDLHEFVADDFIEALLGNDT